MEKKQKKQQHARSRSFAVGGGGLASFFKSTVASFSSTFPSSGGRRSSFNHRNAFSGPTVSIVPPEARGRGRRNSKRSGYATPEPTSPKVSCIGQIKRSSSRRQKKVNPAASACGKHGGACPLPPPRPPPPAEGKPPSRGSLVRRMSFFRRSSSRPSRSRPRSAAASRDGLAVVVGNGKESAHDDGAMAAAAAVPVGLGQMKRFASGRAAFQDFDWREEERTRGRDSDEEEDEDDGFVAHSAPLVLGGGVVASEPRKEVNLWRRRPMAPPAPLQLP